MDDITEFARTQEELQQQLLDLNHHSKKAGLTINYNKIKIITNHQQNPIKIEDTEIEYDQEYVYLG